MDIYNSYPSGDHELLYKRLKIKSGMRVLDVGGGGNPFKFADIVVDKDFNSDNFHRDGCDINLSRSEHIFAQADIHNLPFKDNAFDYVICLHLLEHVDYPEIACKELIRIAKNGFIETPRKWTEYYAGHPSHKWLIDEYNGEIKFEPIAFNDSPFMNFALPPLWDSMALQSKLLYEFGNIPCVQLHWKDAFEFEVIDCLTDEMKLKNNSAQRHYHFAKNLLFWMPAFKTGYFHARTAENMRPGSGRFKKLSRFYSILNGSIKDVFTQHIGIKILVSALILRSFRWIYSRLLVMYRKLLVKNLEKIEREDNTIDHR